jgi:hypothetical protein
MPVRPAADMADSKMSLLKAIARRRRADQVEAEPARSAGRRTELAKAATLARAQVTAARARRRLPRER